MKFMDMMIEETMRLYPIADRIDRVANSDYEFNGMKFEKGTIWVASIRILHMDPDIYPEPEKFDPYRWDEVTKKTRDSSCYLPFGGGPRNCVGKFQVLNSYNKQINLPNK